MRIMLELPNSGPVAARLRADGHDVVVAASPCRETDALAERWAEAAAEGRTLVTANPQLITPEVTCPERHPGGVVLRLPTAQGTLRAANRLAACLGGKGPEMLRHHVVVLSEEGEQWIHYVRLVRGDTAEQIVIPRSSLERFLIAPEPHNQLLDGYDVLMAGMSAVAPPYRIFRRKVLFHLILLVLDGEGEFGTGAAIRPLGPGTSLKAPAGSIYEYRAQSPWRFLWFHLRQGERWDDLFETDCQVELGRWSQTLLRAAEGFLEEAGRQRMDAAVPLRAYADLIAFLLERDLGESSDPARIEERTRLECVWKAVHDDPAALWDVNRMARLAAYSVTHFHRLVRRHAGASPMQVVSRMRMDRARELLRHTHYTLEQIADLTGYQSPFALSKAFKRQMGISPNGFRHLDLDAANGNRRHESASQEHGGSAAD